MDLPEPAAEGCSVIAGEGPEHATSGDVVTYQGADGGDEDQEEEPDSTGGRACGLLIDYGDGKGGSAGEDFVEIGDCVEDRDDVAHHCDESRD